MPPQLIVLLVQLAATHGPGLVANLIELIKGNPGVFDDISAEDIQSLKKLVKKEGADYFK